MSFDFIDFIPPARQGLTAPENHKQGKQHNGQPIVAPDSFHFASASGLMPMHHLQLPARRAHLGLQLFLTLTELLSESTQIELGLARLLELLEKVLNQSVVRSQQSHSILRPTGNFRFG
jgi:hypothetical protein